MDQLTEGEASSSPAGSWGSSVVRTPHSQSYTCCRAGGGGEDKHGLLWENRTVEEDWKQVGCIHEA